MKRSVMRILLAALCLFATSALNAQNLKEVSDPIPDAPGSLRVASTCWDSRKLVTEWKMQRNGETFMHGTDVHSLTSDGQLVVSRTIESPRHHADVRLDLKRVPE